MIHVNEVPEDVYSPLGDRQPFRSPTGANLVWSEGPSCNVSFLRQRTARKRADIQINALRKSDRVKPAGEVWACCCASEIQLEQLQKTAQRKILGSSKLELRFSTFFSSVSVAWVDLLASTSVHSTMLNNLPKRAHVFIFKFGCLAAWDLPAVHQADLLALLEPFMEEPLPAREEDSMKYVWAQEHAIKQDIIHLVDDDSFERLAYSYAFAQSCKLSVFEERVEQIIDRARNVPENLALTGKISTHRGELSKWIGELFITRFYINLHTDILDTPEVFWDFEDAGDYYTSHRSYLELPKRVEILNNRLDIMKDMYDMLNQELTIKHGHKLEWIVIILICLEVLISVVWGILIKDVFKWV